MGATDVQGFRQNRTSLAVKMASVTRLALKLATYKRSQRGEP